MIWLYLLSGSFALYSVETADINQPFHITAIVAILLCLIPTTLEAFLHSENAHGLVKIIRKNQISKTDD